MKGEPLLRLLFLFHFFLFLLFHGREGEPDVFDFVEDVGAAVVVVFEGKDGGFFDGFGGIAFGFFLRSEDAEGKARGGGVGLGFEFQNDLAAFFGNGFGSGEGDSTG